jgi:hypothetical protein
MTAAYRMLSNSERASFSLYAISVVFDHLAISKRRDEFAASPEGRPTQSSLFMSRN